MKQRRFQILNGCPLKRTRGVIVKEFGGYIALDTYHLQILHEKAIALNCGRNALAYLCEVKKIKKIYIPYFLCNSVPNVLNKRGVLYEYYSITEKFLPRLQKVLQEGEWIYLINYYGQLSKETLTDLKAKYGRIIVDNAQSYYQMPVKGVDTLYTCRKYFGVTDGAFLYTDVTLERELSTDESYERMRFLLGCYERTASEFYAEYVANNKLFANEPIKKMSKLTQNLLHGIDYTRVAEQRQSNFDFLHEVFKDINQLGLVSPYGAFMYPLLIENGAEIRKELQKEKIYIPTLWPNVLETCTKDMLEYKFAENIQPLPIDQRYDEKDMKYMAEVIKKCIVKGS